MNPVLKLTPKNQADNVFILLPPVHFHNYFLPVPTSLPDICWRTSHDSSPALLLPGQLKSVPFSATVEACPVPADTICVFLPSLPLLELSLRGISSSSLQDSAIQNRTQNGPDCTKVASPQAERASLSRESYHFKIKLRLF